MDFNKILYILPPWKPLRVDIRPSFIPVPIEFYDTSTDETFNWTFYICRDTIGLCWIVNILPEEYLIKLPKCNYKILPIPKTDDLLMRSWYFHNLAIRQAKVRRYFLERLFKDILDFIQDKYTNTICIPRMIVFKRDDSSLSYAFQIIDGNNPSIVAKSIGNERELLSGDESLLKYLKPPFEFDLDKVLKTRQGRALKNRYKTNLELDENKIISRGDLPEDLDDLSS